jgi:Tat protein secretion system quality control protein TatD with DNase activity
VIAAAIGQNVLQIIVPAYNADSLERTRRVVSARPDILFPAYDIHPWYVNESIDVEALFQPYLVNQSVVAIGEIGLDLPENNARKGRAEIPARPEGIDGHS